MVYSGAASNPLGLAKRCTLCGGRCGSNRARFCSPRCYLKGWAEPQPNGCLYWTGPVGNHGYGYFQHAKELNLTHRAAYREFKGEIPDGLFVCHTCDVKICVNPDHLFLGTHNDNVADMVAKRRNYRKLADEEVRQIRLTAGVTIAELARLYGVGETTIRQIRTREWWKDVH